MGLRIWIPTFFAWFLFYFATFKIRIQIAPAICFLPVPIRQLRMIWSKSSHIGSMADPAKPLRQSVIGIPASSARCFSLTPNLSDTHAVNVFVNHYSFTWYYNVSQILINNLK